MEIVVAGSGTVVPRLERAQSCVVVRTGSETLVMDPGSGALRGMLRAGIDPLTVDRILITHFHPDHTSDLVSLLFTLNYGSESPRSLPLHVYGPEPFEQFWSALQGAWGEWMAGDYPVEVHTLPVRGGAMELPNGTLRWAPARHRPESIAYRLEGDGKSFVYTGDTEYCRSIPRLARGADLLLVECSFPDSSPVPGHLTPSGVARIARESSPARVVLTHIYPQADERNLPEEVKENGYTGEVSVARDGSRFTL
ncbi:MBL fold metallo-hydrolase [Rubrobacter calidifluminis]|uniref:MBL fold metallo-hydrolase n=1 Tax=Rubrobacter calidifluminis TaxID=1392640 RepID=UPI0023619845|nr:ribonuclease Z [Rubrobacter calidifluminis]